MSKQNFTKDFEIAILAGLVQDVKFLREIISVLRVDYFIDQSNAAAAKVIVDTYIKTKSPPSKVGLLGGLVDEMSRQIKTKKESQTQTLIVLPSQELVEKLFAPTGDIADVKLKFAEFCRQREMETILLDSYNKLDTGELTSGDVFEKVRLTHQRINGKEQGGIDFFPTIEDLPAELIEMKGKTYTTGFPSLDMKMGGGAGAGTLTTFIAPPKGGKSMILVNVGYANLLRNKVVIHFTLEISDKKIRKRYASRISRIPMNEMDVRVNEVVTSCAKFWEVHKPRLIIKRYPIRAAGVDDFRSYLYWLDGSCGIRADIILIDYGDILKTSGKRGEQERFAQAEAYEGMRALAQEFDCPVFTASQGNRESLNKTIIKMSDIAEAIAKCAISDHIISICRTDEEDREGKARLYFAGSREAEAGGQVNIVHNWPTSQMQEAAIQVDRKAF